LLLAAFFLANWSRESRIKRIIQYLITLTVLISPIMLFVGSLQVATNPASPAFIEGDQARAFQWLEDHAERGSVVLGGYRTSNALPAWAPVKVPIGHGPESVGLDALEPRVNAIYGNTINSSERWQWLTQSGVAYVFFGSAERALGEWEPEHETYISLVYENETVQIFEVLNAQD
jgi:hypothetical protein